MRSLKKRGPHVLDDLMTSYFPYRMHGQTCQQTPVCFKDVRIHLATILPSTGKHVCCMYNVFGCIFLHISKYFHNVLQST